MSLRKNIRSISSWRSASSLTKQLLGIPLLFALAACGGGGGGGGGSSTTPPPSNGPVSLAAPTNIEDGTRLGTTNASWEAHTPAGQGQPVNGMNCDLPGSTYHYAHLNIYHNGELLTLPQDIGVVATSATRAKSCVYQAHTRDMSGKIRVNTNHPATLGQFFAIWGQPLSRSNVAGLTGLPVKIYINDGGTLTEHTGDLAAVQLSSNREITIVVGSTVSQLPTYNWKNPPPLSTTPIALGTSMIGTPYWPDGNTGSGGQGLPVDGVNCFPTMSNAYHVHAHLAIIRNGQMLAIPTNVGIVNTCLYELHTHDASGTLHTEPTIYREMTLGNFFSVWGQPLSTTNVAGIVGEPIEFYINEGGQVWQYQGDPRDIQLQAHRSITIQIGSAVSAIPSYTWGSLPQ